MLCSMKEGKVKKFAVTFWHHVTKNILYKINLSENVSFIQPERKERTCIATSTSIYQATAECVQRKEFLRDLDIFQH